MSTLKLYVSEIVNLETSQDKKFTIGKLLICVSIISYFSYILGLISNPFIALVPAGLSLVFFVWGMIIQSKIDQSIETLDDNTSDLYKKDHEEVIDDIRLTNALKEIKEKELLETENGVCISSLLSCLRMFSLYSLEKQNNIILAVQNEISPTEDIKEIVGTFQKVDRNDIIDTLEVIKDKI